MMIQFRFELLYYMYTCACRGVAKAFSLGGMEANLPLTLAYPKNKRKIATKTNEKPAFISSPAFISIYT